MATKQPVVLFDFGHGGSDPGAIFGNLVEKEMTLTTGRAAVEEMERHGVATKTTRNSDVYVGINERAAKANALKVDYFVSIHYNAGGGDGVEAIHGVYAGVSKDLAQSIVNSIKALGQNARPREVFSRMTSSGTDYHGVIRMTNMPATIIEGAFIDSKDRDIVDTIAEQEAMGVAIAHGVLKYLKIKILPAKKPVKESAAKPAPAKKNQGVVTADELNVRSGVGVSFPVTSVLKKGAKISILETKSNWHKILVSAADYGWVSGAYVKDGKIVNCSLLNVRKGPGADTKAFTQLKVGASVKVVETKNGWHRIVINPAEYGWVSGAYIK